MSLQTRFYHGTTAQGLTSFELGQGRFGEMCSPVNGIWLATRREGAQWHANCVAGRKHGTDGIIYECELEPNCLLADTKVARLPTLAHSKFMRLHMPWYRRLADLIGGKVRERFAAPEHWLFYAYRASAKYHHRHETETTMNSLIDVCLSVGISVLINPSTNLHGKTPAHFDESVYGTVALLLDPHKARIVREYLA